MAGQRCVYFQRPLLQGKCYGYARRSPPSDYCAAHDPSPEWKERHRAAIAAGRQRVKDQSAFDQTVHHWVGEFVPPIT